MLGTVNMPAWRVLIRMDHFWLGVTAEGPLLWIPGLHIVLALLTGMLYAHGRPGAVFARRSYPIPGALVAH